MAPEVVLCKNYGKSADVYSFAILLWQVLALETPYRTYDYEKHARKVVLGKKRPKIVSSWSVFIKQVLLKSWGDDP